LSVTYFSVLNKVNPRINIDINISREDAKDRAENILRNFGVNVDKYKNVIVFLSNSAVENYFDKNLDSKTAGKLMSDQINTWAYSSRFFIPSEKEEYEVEIDNKGRFSGFSHTIPEEAVGGRLSVEEAQKTAEDFIKGNTQINLTDYSLVETDDKEMPERKDYNFTYEHNTININNAKYRLWVKVSGSEVTNFSQYLKIPEAYSRKELEILAHNETAQTVANVAYLLLFSLAMLFIFVKKFKERQLNYKTAFKVASVVSFITLLGIISSLREITYNYYYLDTWASFILNNIFSLSLAVFVSGFFTFLLFLVCEATYREIFPSELAMANIFSKNIISNKAYQKAFLFGAIGGVLVLFYQVAYYYFGKKFGIWSPTEINQGNVFSGYLPWVEILLIGILPAISEELTFRLFGISLFKKIFKKTWIGVIAASLIWAFLHSAYPQQPFFARGLELFPVGLFFSFLYLRYGILASISAHYTLNSFLVFNFLLKNQLLSTKVIGIVLILLPLALFFIGSLYRSRRGESDDDVIDNNSLTETLKIKAVKENVVKKINYTFKGFSKRWFIFGATIIAIGVVIFIYDAIYHPESELTINESINIDENISREEIINKSDKFLSEKGVDLTNYKKVAEFSEYFSDLDKKYLLELPDGYNKFKQIYNKEIPAFLWGVRYFKPMDKESYYINLLADGTVFSYHHAILDTESGASLLKDEAINITSKYLLDQNKIIDNQYEVVSAIESKEENRMDYNVVFKDKRYDLDKGSLRKSVTLKGDKIDSYGVFIDIPEAWLDNNEKTGTKEFIINAIIAVFSLFWVIYTFISFLKLSRQKLIQWKNKYKLALFLSVLLLIMTICSLTTYYSGYDAIENIKLFHAKSVIMNFIGLASAFLLLWLGFSFLVALWNENIGNVALPASKKEKLDIFRDTIMFGYLLFFLGIIIMVSGVYFSDFLMKKYNWYKYLLDLPMLDSSINNFLPEFYLVLENIYYLLITPLSIIPLLIMYRLLKRWWAVLLLLYIVSILGIFLEKDFGQIVFNLVMATVVFIFIFLMLAIIKRNLFYLPMIIYIVALFSYIDLESNQWYASSLNLLVLFGLLLPIGIYWLVKNKSIFDKYLEKSGQNKTT
jgi:membrane protease YdiL (CAAX protease family)